MRRNTVVAWPRVFAECVLIVQECRFSLAVNTGAFDSRQSDVIPSRLLRAIFGTLVRWPSKMIYPSFTTIDQCAAFDGL